MNKIENNLNFDLDFFIQKEAIHINNTENILTLFDDSIKIINDKYLIEDIHSFKNHLVSFSEIIEENYFLNIEIVKQYLNENYTSWLVDQIENKNIIKNIEFFIDFNINNLNKENFEKLNNSIKIINTFFLEEEHSYLVDQESIAINALVKYIEFPTIKNSDSIILTLSTIKKNINWTNDNNQSTSEVESIKNDTEEILELKLPEILDNLYNYFSRLFNRKRKYIEATEILTLQKIITKADIYIIENKNIYSDIIVEQFTNCTKYISELDTTKIKEFNEDEILKMYNNLIIILKEISIINKKQKH